MGKVMLAILLGALSMRAAADTFSAECDAMEHSCDVDDTSLLQEPAKPWHTHRRALHSMPSGPVGLPQLAQYRHAATSQGYNLTELLTAKISDTNTSECPSLQTMLFLKNSAANAKDMDLSLEVVMLVVLIASGVLIFLGHHLVIPTIFFVVASAGGVPTFKFVLDSTDYCLWPLVAGGVVFLIAGCCAVYFINVAFTIVGWAIGALAALQFEVAIMALANEISEEYAVYIFWAVVVVAAIVGGILMYYFEEDIFSVVTAAVGAYGLKISLSSLLVAEKGIEMTEEQQLVLVIVAFALGVLVQEYVVHEVEK
mmetsp:Transcript_74744/g.136555  ORF Transcript_74744/g.136555 Transcript_74744/m.136555 type:complete len:312 (+) Transcript_74744:84-1019(+)